VCIEVRLFASADFVKFALQMAAMLGAALFFGQVMRRLKQPAVLGEMIGGILIGPTVFGLLFPSLFGWLFAPSPAIDAVREASIKLGMLFFLFISGLEINLSDFTRMGRRALTIGLVATLLPILAGVALVLAVPVAYWGAEAAAHRVSFALFIGLNLANSANPVIARILMDLGLLNQELGATIMTATVVDDLMNWTLFAIILADVLPDRPAASGGLPVTILLIFGLFVVILGLGRRVAPRALPWLRTRLSWPTGFIAFTTLAILLAGAAAESLGIHAFLGAFLAGMAVSGSNPQAKEAHDVIAQFALSFFAPLYFVSMGMSANFLTHFDWGLVLLLVTVACVSKVGAALLGARLAGMPLDRHAWAIAFGLNARGATGIILAGVGLQNGLISERVFVAIAVMAIVTSLMSGPVIQALIQRRVRLTLPAGSVGSELGE
jgi:Kef-type K+ transport system membrane component KefB